MSGVMTLLRRPATWEEARRALSDAGFMGRLIAYDKDTLDDALLRKVAKVTADPNFNTEAVGRVSLAAKGMCMWVRAMEAYGAVARDIAPKRARLRAAQEALVRKREALAAAHEALATALAHVAELRTRYEESTARRAALEAELATLHGRLSRAERLVAGLAGERERWSISIAALEARATALPGDALVAAGFATYLGAFPPEQREEIVRQGWLPKLRAEGLPLSAAFDLAAFLLPDGAATLREWHAHGLPQDPTSAENGAIVEFGRRWPLMIDPQGQAARWVTRLQSARGVATVNANAADVVRQAEACASNGRPLLLVDCGEEQLDAGLMPLLSQSYTLRRQRCFVRLSGREVEVAQGFRLYLATRLPSPSFAPELTTHLAVVNFVVKRSGLEAQMLAEVVRHERPDVDAQRGETVVKIADGRRALAVLEDRILDLLATVDGNLLDNITLVEALDRSKATWEEVRGVNTSPCEGACFFVTVATMPQRQKMASHNAPSNKNNNTPSSHQVNKSLIVAETAAAELEKLAAAYVPVAARSAALYLALDALSALDPMYRFGLDGYAALFAASLRLAPRAVASAAAAGATALLQERIKAINDHHTYGVYRFAARALLERHKLLLSMHLAAQVLSLAGAINDDEWAFFLHGNLAADKRRRSSGEEPAADNGALSSADPGPNPSPAWLSGEAWARVVALDAALPSFRGLAASMAVAPVAWEAWFRSAEPETEEPPREWAEAGRSAAGAGPGDLQRLILVSCLRPDRVLAAATAFAAGALGRRFVEAPTLDLSDVLADCLSPTTPLLLIVSPGVDPAESLARLAAETGRADRLISVALGQGQAPAAQRLLDEAARSGSWLHLANCHLMTEWLPALDKILDKLEASGSNGRKAGAAAVHDQFRLWLSSAPTDEFPAPLLQRAVKAAVEPPRGLRANLTWLYAGINDERFEAFSGGNGPSKTVALAVTRYQRLLFCLAFFHASILERRKFGTLGLNVPYDFSVADFT